MTGAMYYAVPDPADPARMTYWRRTGRGLRPIPANARYGPVLLKHDVPADLRGQQRREWVYAWQRQHLYPWHATVHAAIDADPIGCAARYAALQARCAWCGRRLTDPDSKTYGIGPDCRQGWPPAELAALAQAVARAHASNGPLSAPLRQDPAPSTVTGRTTTEVTP